MRFLARLVPYFAVGIGLLYLKNAWLALLGYHLGILLFLGLGRAYSHFHRFRPLLHPGWAFTAWILACLAGLLLYLGWDGLPLPSNLPVLLSHLGLTASSWPWFIAYFALVNPWLEEAYWRGWLFVPGSLPLPQDVWFAGYHSLILAPFLPLNWIIIAIGLLTGVSWLWRQIVHRTDNLFIPGVAHLLADLTILTAIYLRTTFS